MGYVNIFPVKDHYYFMSMALEQAYRANGEGEVPVGAVVVKRGEVIAKAYNQVIKRNDPTAHAEILALREAASILKNYRLIDTTLYVTVEPCLMCGGALIQARVNKLIFGTFDPKMGAFGSIYNLAEDKRLNHRIEVESGILEEECCKLIKIFFKKRRRGTEEAITGSTRNRLVL